MSLLVQRVSGALSGHLFYPQVAGVGLSYNPYVWNEGIDPEAGMLRLVFGLGTRAVDRSDDDYTRVVALNDPQRRPESSFDEVRRYTQRRVDTLDLAANRLVANDFIDVVNQSPTVPLEMFASRDPEIERMAAETNRRDLFPWILTFERLLSQTSFPEDMRHMLKSLQTAYGSPVDVEFTANFFDRRRYKINLVQCRPLQVSEGEKVAEAAPQQVDESQTVLTAHGAVIGHSRDIQIDRIVQVVPSVYGRLPVKERYSVARLIGQLMHIDGAGPSKTLIMGPGRWGTTTPSLGVPVSFAEISSISVLCEIVAMREDLIPDVSLGTHFFNELVECDILYLALFPNRPDNFMNEQLLGTLPNRLTDLLPDAANRADVVRVIDSADLPPGRRFKLHADNVKQQVICYMANE
jgi:pyruvate, water dikinase